MNVAQQQTLISGQPLDEGLQSLRTENQRASSPVLSEEDQLYVDLLRKHEITTDAPLRGLVKLNESVIFQGTDCSLESFIAAFEDKGLNAICELRQQLNLPRQIPLGKVIALVETIIADGDDSLRAKYKEIFDQNGLMQEHLLLKLFLEHDVPPRDISQIIENQSPQAYRSIVEVTCNAIDFSPKNENVEVNLGPRGYQITDAGSGMSEREIFEKLLIPTVSGPGGLRLQVLESSEWAL